MVKADTRLCKGQALRRSTHRTQMIGLADLLADFQTPRLSAQKSASQTLSYINTILDGGS